MNIFKQKLVDTLDNVLCDVCNKSCKHEMNYEVARLSVNWGYESKNDGDAYCIDLCEDCFERTLQHLKSIAVDPERLKPRNDFR
jgi:hypothetical protein